MQGYFRIRQTAAELRKKKEERESRRRDRETAENPLENDGKFKVEEVAMGDSKDSDKVLNASRLENNDLLPSWFLHQPLLSCGCFIDVENTKGSSSTCMRDCSAISYFIDNIMSLPTHCRQILNIDMLYVQNGSRPDERERYRRERRYYLHTMKLSMKLYSFIFLLNEVCLILCTTWLYAHCYILECQIYSHGRALLYRIDCNIYVSRWTI